MDIVKRVHFSCNEEVYSKVESLKHLLRLKRDEVMELAINDLFKEIIASYAKKEGLIEACQEIVLKREFFDETKMPGEFDSICGSLGLTTESQQQSSISSIKLEIQKSEIVD